jgi:hypothetical protein
MPMLPTVLNNQEIIPVVSPIDAGVSCHMQGLWARQETPCENNKPLKS